MKRSRILLSLVKIPLDFSVVFSSFYIARAIRRITDLIPGVSLPIQTISDASLLKFAMAWSLMFILVQAFRGAYHIEREKNPLILLTEVFVSGFVWFLFYIATLYLGNEYLYHTEIPRLIVFFAFFLIVLWAWIARLVVLLLSWFLHRKNLLYRTKIFVYGKGNETILDTLLSDASYDVIQGGLDDLLLTMRTNSIDEVMVLGANESQKTLREIISLSRIYGIRVRLSEGIDQWVLDYASLDFVDEFPVLSFHFVGLNPWWRVLKRLFDIVVSGLALIFLSPFFFLIALAIKMEDPEGPAIYTNRRIGKNGKPFDLYKFRYIYWKYCVKDAYGVPAKSDEALKYEESLKKDLDGRNGPLYKIQNDPRKTKIGRFIEKYSIDELPQLWNVFVGNMSLVGPRPHQPREVELYDEWHKQVLTLKPGITGMAQTHGRHKNSFDQEVALDTYYIEHWSLWLDIRICLRTIVVVLLRKTV